MFVTLGVAIVNAYAGGPALLRAHPELELPLRVYTNISNLSYYTLFLIPLIFPDGRFVPRWTRWLIPLIIVWAILPFSQMNWLVNGITILWAGIVLVSPIYRYRRVSDPTQREQTKWVMFGLLTTIAVFFSLSLIQVLVPYSSARPERTVLLALIGGTIGYLAFSFLPVSFGVAILRYRLWDIDVLINRTLVYGSLTVSLVALYIAGVIALQALFRAITGQTSDLAVAIATLAIATLFNPWRHRLQSFIDRRFYRRKYDAAHILAAFSSKLRNEVDLDEVSRDLIAVLQETVQPANAAIWLADRGRTT
jgi:hypothetical protein